MGQIINMQRLGRLLRWTFVTDLPYYKKTMWTSLGAMIVIFQFVNIHMGSPKGFFFVKGALTGLLFYLLVVSPANFFISYSNRKEGMRDLFVLPASNLEKFLVRYLFTIFIFMVTFFISCLGGDILQYVVGLVLGREPLGSVLWEVVSSSSFHPTWNKAFFVGLMLLLWIHTFYLVGANFQRNIKTNFILPSFVLLALFIAVMVMLPDDGYGKGKVMHEIVLNHGVLIGCLLLAASIFNYFISYRLFCRRQLIGRFINTL